MMPLRRARVLAAALLLLRMGLSAAPAAPPRSPLSLFVAPAALACVPLVHLAPYRRLRARGQSASLHRLVSADPASPTTGARCHVGCARAARARAGRLLRRDQGPRELEGDVRLAHLHAAGHRAPRGQRLMRMDHRMDGPGWRLLEAAPTPGAAGGAPGGVATPASDPRPVWPAAAARAPRAGPGPAARCPAAAPCSVCRAAGAWSAGDGARSHRGRDLLPLLIGYLPRGVLTRGCVCGCGCGCV